MARSRSVCLIGQFGDLDTQFNGQSIKSINFRRLLERTGWFDRVTIVDTSRQASHRLRVLLHTLRALLASRHVVLMVSMKGKSFYYPFLYFASFLLPLSLYQNVIGGKVTEGVRSNRKWVVYLNRFIVNWAETPGMADELRSLGVRNAQYLPNFRFGRAAQMSRSDKLPDEPAYFCTFSRVTTTKGITEAIESVARLNADRGKAIAHLDVYGEVDPNFEARFEALLSANSDCVSYKGTVSSSSATNAISGYHMLLFPTYHPGEGLAGTLIDALQAGVPVIASDWRFNGEVVRHEREGLLFDLTDPDGLYRCLAVAIDNTDLVRRMADQCARSAERFSAETVTELISPYFSAMRGAPGTQSSASES